MAVKVKDTDEIDRILPDIEDTEKYVRDKALKERDRALYEEALLGQRISKEVLDREEAVRKEAEERAKQDEVLSQEILKEVERATAAEEGLRDDIDAEVDRAMAEEASLKKQIEEEADRAQEQEELLKLEVAKKLDRVEGETDYPQVYAKSESGAQEMIDFSKSAVGGTIAQRDENGNINVSSPINGSNATNKKYVDDRDAELSLAIEEEESRAEAAESLLQDAIEQETLRATTKETELSEDIESIKEKIPEQASADNPLADKNFVNSSIEQSAANRVTYDADGSPFPTRASLLAATTFYYAGAAYTPNEHDYALVTADEGAPNPFTNGQTRFEWSGGSWVYAYGINDRPFTAAERAALESGITQEKVQEIDDKLDKSSEVSSVYGTNSQGNQIMIPVSNFGTSEDVQKSVKYTPQTLDESQKARARENIGAAAEEDLQDYLPLSGGTISGTLDVADLRENGKKLYSEDNPPPYPVTSVNGKTGAVVIPNATQTQDGLMSKEDKIKLDSGSGTGTGLEGLGIFRSSYSATTSTASIPISTIVIPEGRSLKEGDLLIADSTYSYLFRISSVGDTNVTVSYLQRLRGNDGTDGQDGVDGVTPNISVTASVSNTVGTPSVQVTKSGTVENPSFAFNFSSLKGEKGEDGTSVNILGSVENQSLLPSTGNERGDGYIVEATGHLFVWSGSQWVDAGEIKGPKGDKGDKGDKGNKGDTGDPGQDGVDGEEGLGIFRSSTSTTTGTTSISTSTITVPSGRSLKVGDLIIANSTYSYLYRVTAVSSSTVTVSYLQSLRGATGSTGSAGDDGENGHGIFYSSYAAIESTIVIDKNTIDQPSGFSVGLGDLILANSNLYRVNQNSSSTVGVQYLYSLKGEEGVTPTISATASVSNTAGTPSVQVTKSGSNENPSFAFAFSGIKGEPGSGASVPSLYFHAIRGDCTGSPAAQFTSFVINTDGTGFTKSTFLRFINDNGFIGNEHVVYPASGGVGNYPIKGIRSPQSTGSEIGISYVSDGEILSKTYSFSSITISDTPIQIM